MLTWGLDLDGELHVRLDVELGVRLNGRCNDDWMLNCMSSGALNGF